MVFKSFHIYLWVVPLFLILSCSDYENPFKSPAYSKAHIKECGIPDTLTLFDTREVSIGVLVSEFVDSFRVTCPGNRFFRGGDSTLRIENQDDRDVHFNVSMTDTGASVFRVESYLTNGEIRDTSISFYVYSQFDLEKIQGFFDNKTLGEPIVVELENPVPDRDAVYNWCFGGGQNYKKTEPLCTLLVNTKSDSGVLFLSDNSGTESVRFCFPIGISDTEEPVVILMNSMVSEQGDTVFAGSDDFNFYVRIIDNSVEPLNKVRINGSGFDSVLQSNTYLKFFNNLSRDNDSTTEIEVYAEDKSGNSTVKRLVLFYNPDGVSVTDDKAYFLVNYPKDSIVYTSSISIPFSGEAGNLSDDTVRFVTEINGEEDTTITLNPGSGINTWLNRVEIDTGGSIFSNVYLYLLNNTGDTISSGSYNILYHKDLSDTIPPSIVDVKVSDSVSAEGYVTSDSIVELSVLAFDEGSGIKEIKVFYSDTSQFIYSEEGSYLYTDMFNISHIKDGNTFNFIARDSAGFA
ncbi:MAG: hypothetical protein ACOCSE_04995, partial [Chitinivibrionales bacterium]